MNRSTVSKVPHGVLVASFDDLFQAGCMQTGRDVTSNFETAVVRFGDLYNLLYRASGGNVCKGCPQYAGGACHAFKKFHTSQRSQKSTLPAPPPRARCAKCGRKIRGENHDQFCKGSSQ